MSHFVQPPQRPNVGLVWFRGTDLRLHDNEVVARAHANHDYVVHIFCWDDRVFRDSVDFSRSLPVTSWPKTGVHRSKFVLESIQDLRSSIVTASNEKQNLYLRKGLSEEVVAEMANLVGAKVVYCFEPEAPEECDLQDKLRANLQSISGGCRLHSVWGNTMYHIDDMPSNFMEKFPSSATQFRTVVERKSRVRDPIASPGSPIAKRCPAFKPLPPVLTDTSQIPIGDIPTLSELLGRPLDVEKLGNAPVSNMQCESGSTSLMTFVGGETAGLARVQEYFFTKNCLKDYFSTRNGLLGADYSSKFSPWLAAGCLSARHIAAEVKRYELERVKSKETYWMLFELTFRDYFRYYTRFNGSKVFKLWGPKGKQASHRPKVWNTDLADFEAWRIGQTGNPMIDANMRELLHTGFMSNRGRQIVASYLTRDMGMDWRLGAMHFESLLVDHDVCLNWGNWTYAAGVGSDPREDRYFSIPKQTANYDPQHRFIKFWCEEARLMSSAQLNSRLKIGMKPRCSPIVMSNANSALKSGGKGKRGVNGEDKRGAHGAGNNQKITDMFKKYTRIKIPKK